MQVFLENQINGELLVALDESDFETLGFSKFQTKKVMKYINGWRPDAHAHSDSSSPSKGGSSNLGGIFSSDNCEDNSSDISTSSTAVDLQVNEPNI